MADLLILLALISSVCGSQLPNDAAFTSLWQDPAFLRPPAPPHGHLQQPDGAFRPSWMRRRQRTARSAPHAKQVKYPPHVLDNPPATKATDDDGAGTTSTTFVSSHYRIPPHEVSDYLTRKALEYHTSPQRFTLKYCPKCPPHRNKPDNLFKLEVFRDNGNCFCHRCGFKGSFYDLKRALGDLPTDVLMSLNPDQQAAAVLNRGDIGDAAAILPDQGNVTGFASALMEDRVCPGMLERLQKERGLTKEVLDKYHVGAGVFTFRSKDNENDFVTHECVTFPWITVEDGHQITLRYKVRSMSDKSCMRLEPKGGVWGLFGEHTIPDTADSIVLTEGEFDAMAVHQATGLPAVSLPNGARSLPVALLPFFERFKHIYLWMDADGPGQEGAEHFSHKLGIGRTFLVKDPGPGNIPANIDTGDDTEALRRPPKDANEALIKGYDLRKMIDVARPMPHSQILNFGQLRGEVLDELRDPGRVNGVQSLTVPGLNRLLKGHRPGELSIWTGGTGIGKTTLLSQLSLDYCLQGVPTLWGSFEINNLRLAKMMMRQFSGCNLEHQPDRFDYFANRFSSLPIYFLRFHGSTDVDQVLDAMDYAVYVLDVKHIVLDNLQFMLSGQAKGNEGWDLQNTAIEKFRRFATTKNVHISLVVHPRKEDDGTLLGIASVFGSVKCTQEADNVCILQRPSNSAPYVDIKKNRFAGELGRVSYVFDKESLTIQQLDVQNKESWRPSPEELRAVQAAAKGRPSMAAHHDQLARLQSMTPGGSGHARPPPFSPARDVMTNVRSMQQQQQQSANEAEGDQQQQQQQRAQHVPAQAVDAAVHPTKAPSRRKTAASTTTSAAAKRAATASKKAAPAAAKATKATKTAARRPATAADDGSGQDETVASSAPPPPPPSDAPSQVAVTQDEDPDTDDSDSDDSDDGSQVGVAQTSSLLTFGRGSRLGLVGTPTASSSSSSSSSVGSRRDLTVPRAQQHGGSGSYDMGGLWSPAPAMPSHTLQMKVSRKHPHRQLEMSRPSHPTSTALLEPSQSTWQHVHHHPNLPTSGHTSVDRIRFAEMDDEKHADEIAIDRDALERQFAVPTAAETAAEANTTTDVTEMPPMAIETTVYDEQQQQTPAIDTADEQGQGDDGIADEFEGAEVELSSMKMTELRVLIKEHGLDVKTGGRSKQQVCIDIRQALGLPAAPATDCSSAHATIHHYKRGKKEDQDHPHHTDTHTIPGYTLTLSPSSRLQDMRAVIDQEGLDIKSGGRKKSAVLGDIIAALKVRYSKSGTQLHPLPTIDQSADEAGPQAQQNTTSAFLSVDPEELVVFGPPEDEPFHDDLMSHYYYIQSPAALDKAAHIITNASLVGVDIETTGLDPLSECKIRLVQLAVEGHPVVVIDAFKVPLDSPSMQPVRDMLASPDVRKVFQNGKFEAKFFKTVGYNISTPLLDTMIASKLLEAGKGKIGFRLDHLAERYLGIYLSKTQQRSDWGADLLTEEQILYAARDASVLLPLRHVLVHKLQEADLVQVASLEMRCMLAVADMELNGLGLDQDKWRVLADELKEKERDVLARMRETMHLDNDTVINFNSQPQLLQVFRNLSIPGPDGTGEIQDTNDFTLNKLQQYPAIQALRDYRKVSKAIQAFVDKLTKFLNPRTGRIHPNFNQNGAESGRFSCDSPNLQQIPRDPRFRSCFVPRPGHKFVIADFSQIELRIAADLAEDQTMIEAYAKGEDLHKLTASLVTGKPISEVQKPDRQLAKAVNFGLIYGMSPHRFKDYAESGYGVTMTEADARKFHKAYFDHYKGITNWHKRSKSTRNRETRTRSNRRAVFPTFQFTKSLNYPVQGTSADITKESLARLPPLLEPIGGRVVLCVHDEIIVEVPEQHAQEALRILVSTMEAAGDSYLRHVPCVADGAIGDSWAEKP